MAGVKLVRGTLNGATVQTTEEIATRLGGMFEPEKKAPAKKAAAKKS